MSLRIKFISLYRYDECDDAEDFFFHNFTWSQDYFSLNIVSSPQCLKSVVTQFKASQLISQRENVRDASHILVHLVNVD